jgi:catechol 2,3-dioxygenase-like lactoylglutathione lyase family enzyme
LNGDEVDHLGFQVEDVDLAFADLVNQGVEVALTPFNEGNDRLAFIKDPDGIWIELEGPGRVQAGYFPGLAFFRIL